MMRIKCINTIRLHHIIDDPTKVALYLSIASMDFDGKSLKYIPKFACVRDTQNNNDNDNVSECGLIDKLIFYHPPLASVEFLEFSSIFSDLQNMVGIDNKASETIIESAVKIVKCEQSFVDLIAMSSKLMKEYIMFVADRLCYVLIAKQIYNVKNILDGNHFIAHKVSFL